MAKIYDCCMFFQELDMLELRMNILGDVVDYFVVCEAPETHSGQPKPFVFWDNLERFSRWENKIIYLRTDKLTDHSDNSWHRERYHRGYIANGLTGARAEDFVIIGDCDEIADPDIVETLREIPANCPAVKFELDFYYYDFNHRVKEGWAIGAYRWGAEKDPNKIRTCASWNPIELRDSGWHFSYFGTPEQVVQKVNAFMHHADVAKDMPRDPAWVAQQMSRGADLFGRTIQIEHVPLSDTLPRYVLENLGKYKALGWVQE